MSTWKKYCTDSFLLKEAVVYLWRAKLICADNQIKSHEKNLSLVELDRANRFVKTTDRIKYILAKSIQRDIMSRYLNIKPADIKFELGEHGKPYISGNLLQFNLSHAGDWLLMGVTQSAHIGVDIECEKPSADITGIVKRFFSEPESQAIELLSESERTKAFYRAWTRKESFIKADGRGLSFPLSDFSVDVSEAPVDQNTLLEIRGSISEAQDWNVRSVDDLPEKYYAAFAMDKAPKKVFYWDWSLK